VCYIKAFMIQLREELIGRSVTNPAAYISYELHPKMHRKDQLQAQSKIAEL
jgi:hypothetical protein